MQAALAQALDIEMLGEKAADALLGADQNNLLAVHAAERAHIQRKGWCIATGVGLPYLGMVDTDLVAASGDPQRGADRAL